MRTKKKLSKTRILFRRTALSTTALVIAVVVFFELTVRDRLELAIIAQIKSVSSTAINTAVNDYIKDNEKICANMVDIYSDDSSNVKSISEDAYTVNVLKTDIIDVTQSAVNDVMKTHGINVKLGNFTGLNILSDIGPVVPIDIDATTNISCEVESSFESSGLNQTLHRIKLDMYVDIYVGNPIRIESVAYKTSYEVAQTLIVGNTPSAYGSISTRY